MAPEADPAPPATPPPRGHVRNVAFAVVGALLLYASSCGPALLGTQLLKNRYPTATWIEDVVFVAYYPHLDLAFLSEGYFGYLNRFWIKGGAGFQTHEEFKYAWAQRSGYPGHERK
jgi:hypothetical protein